MESWLLAKLSKPEILLLATILFCYLRPSKISQKAFPKVLWILLLAILYWQIISPDYWLSPDRYFGLQRWQFCLKFCLVLHAAVSWSSISAISNNRKLLYWLIPLLFSMLLTFPTNTSTVTIACLLAHLLLIIFLPKRSKRKTSMILTTLFLSLVSIVVWHLDTSSQFISMIYWLPVLSLLMGLGLLSNFCKNHIDTELKDFVFYLIGLTWILGLHFVVMRSICWTPPSVSVDITVLLKIALAWLWVLLGFHWCLPKKTGLHSYSLIIPFGIVLCLFVQSPQAKTFQALCSIIPIFFMQLWWLERYYQSFGNSDSLERLFLAFNCLLLIGLNWYLNPTSIGIWNFSPTLTTIYGLTFIVSCIGLFRRSDTQSKDYLYKLIWGAMIALGLSYFISTVSNPLYLHLRDEYKESSLVIESVTSNASH